MPATAQILGWQRYTTANSGLPDNRIHAVEVDASNGHVWVGTDYGLARFDGTTWTDWHSGTSGLPDNSVRSLEPDGTGGMWVGTFAGGLAHFDGGSTWEIYNTSNSPLPDLFIRSMALDGDTGMWIGTTGGLVHWVDTLWHVYTLSNSDLYSNNIACIYAPRQDTAWIGTVNGGLYFIEGDDWTTHRIITTGIIDNSILGVVEEKPGRPWIATPAGGLGYWAGAWYRWNTSNSGLPTNSLQCIERDSSMGTWLGSTDKGLIWKSPADLFLQVTCPDSFVRCMDYDPAAQALWVGTNDSGLVRYTLPPVAVQEAVQEHELLVWPLPAAEEFFVEVQQPMRMTVMDMTGKTLWEDDLRPGQTRVSTQGWASQQVLLMVQDQRGRRGEKVVTLLGR